MVVEDQPDRAADDRGADEGEHGEDGLDSHRGLLSRGWHRSTRAAQSDRWTSSKPPPPSAQLRATCPAQAATSRAVHGHQMEALAATGHVAFLHDPDSRGIELQR